MANAQRDPRQTDALDADTYYDGTHWAGWSAEYGCPNVPLNPFGDTPTSGIKRFCRGRGRSNFAQVPESVQYRFCTLPEKKADRPWIYEGAQPEFNQYPTPNKPITTLWNPAIDAGRFNEINRLLAVEGQTPIPTSFNDASVYAGPSGQDEKLTNFKDLFIGLGYTDRETVYSDPETYASKRIACDPRLEETAKDCYEKAFDADGAFIATDSICSKSIPDFNGFTLEDVRQRQINSGSGSKIPTTLGNKPSIAVNVKESIIANTVLLIESYLEDGISAAITAHIDPAYTYFRSNKRVCAPQCPVPSEWSPWTCHCSKSGLPNPDNLVDCQCGKQTRSRIQTCTIVENNSCEIYHEGITGPNDLPYQFSSNNFDYSNAAAEFETCSAYGYQNYRENEYAQVYLRGQNLKSVIDYLGNGTDTSLTDTWYPGPHADDQCIGTQVVSKAAFINKLNNPTSDEFTFAREDDVCAATNVIMHEDVTECSKTCGCGTFTKTFTCKYKGGDNDGEDVPVDSDDYKCGCTPKDPEIHACNTQCCPVWHQCVGRDCDAFTPNYAPTSLVVGQENYANANFVPGINFRYEVCGKKCGPELVEGELRCMCDDQCVLDYAADVIVNVVVNAKAPVYTEHKWDTCAAGIKSTTDGVSKNIISVPLGTVDYRITRNKDCEHPCCVKIKINDNSCPALDCLDLDFTLPWNINYDK